MYNFAGKKEMNKKFVFIAEAKPLKKTDIFAKNNATNVTIAAVNLRREHS
jgi:hypothetical protein